VSNPDPAGATPGSPHVLLVDDDDDLAQVVSRALQRFGFLVHRSRAGNEALASLPNLNRLDAAVVDLVLPGAGGLDVVRGIRRAFPGCRIVAMTGLAEPVMEQAFHAAGADIFLAKPVELTDLLQALKPQR
jgi:two-component system, OmpR family, response regulator